MRFYITLIKECDYKESGDSSSKFYGDEHLFESDNVLCYQIFCDIKFVTL
jgi:hypothetical protein